MSIPGFTAEASAYRSTRSEELRCRTARGNDSSHVRPAAYAGASLYEGTPMAAASLSRAQGGAVRQCCCSSDGCACVPCPLRCKFNCFVGSNYVLASCFCRNGGGTIGGWAFPL